MPDRPQPIDHQTQFKPHPRKKDGKGGVLRDSLGRLLPDLPTDEDGRYIVQAIENEQAGMLIYGSLCPVCNQALWLSFPEGQDFGLADHSCGARLKYVKGGA